MDKAGADLVFQATTRPGTHPGTATGQPGPAPPSAADRACQQERQALSYCERPDPAVEERCPRSRDGTLRCPAQFPGAPDALATDGLIGINLNVCRGLYCSGKRHSTMR